MKIDLFICKIFDIVKIYLLFNPVLFIDYILLFCINNN
jgi:hypothetical protein